MLAQHDKGVQRFERASDGMTDRWIFDHSVFGEMRAQQGMQPYVKNPRKYNLVPAVARVLHIQLEERLKALQQFANETELNRVEWNGGETGIPPARPALEERSR